MSTPVTTVSGRVQIAGKPVAVNVVSVTDGPLTGGAAMPVVDVTNLAGYTQPPGDPIDVVAVTDRIVEGGSAVPVWVVSGSLSPLSPSSPQLGTPSVAALNTTVANDLSPDGISWAAVKGAAIVDSFGKIVIYGQRYNSNTRLCYFIWSNDNGVTWADNTGIVGGEGFLVRGDIVYDSARDCFHGLIVTTNPSDGGIIYRRYTITRDGANNITSIARVGGVSVVLDDAAADNGNLLEFPTIRMSDTNTLLAAWTIKTGTGGEIRACKCDITSNANAGGTASNWVHIGINSTTTIGAPPAVGSYTIPFTQAITNPTYFSLYQQSNGDLRWVYQGGSGSGSYRTRRSVRNAANTWNSLSSAVVLTNVNRNGTDSGYALKNQLISQISEKSGVCFVGLATWKSNASGDTWGVYAIAADDSLSASTDVYSAGGAHSYAPTGDCAYDSTADCLVITYEQTTTQDGYVGLLTPALAIAQAFAAFETATNLDIPVIANTRVSGNVLIIWRVAGSPPQIGKRARIPWAA